MDPSFVNKFVTDFLVKNNVETLVDVWMSDTNQTFLFPKKKHHKSAYLFFCEDERRRLRALDPPITKRDEVHTIMSANWELLKKAGGPEYEKYIAVSNGGNVTVQYEVTKPFHKFSLEQRSNIVSEFPNETSIAITNRLKESWKCLSREEKEQYKI